MQRPIDPELQLFPLQIGKLVFPFVEIQEHDLVSAVIRKACPLEYPGIGFALFRIEYPGAECRCNAALMLFTLDDAMAKSYVTSMICTDQGSTSSGKAWLLHQTISCGGTFSMYGPRLMTSPTAP